MTLEIIRGSFVIAGLVVTILATIFGSECAKEREFDKVRNNIWFGLMGIALIWLGRAL